MLREHQSCLFNSVPIIDCGRDMRVPEPVLAAINWPATIVLALAAGFAAYAVLRARYRHEIDWNQEPEPKQPLRPVEDVSRDAGA